MAGSKKYFIYTTDDGTAFGLLADESNVEAVMEGSAGDYTASNDEKYLVPSNLKPRCAVYSSTSGTRKIKIPVLTRAKYDSLPTDVPTITDPVAGTGTLMLTQMIPERITLMPMAGDTGLTDGDDT